jgi:hypothetical protein
MERADFQHHEVERSEAFADRLVLGREAGIAAEEHRVAIRADDERGPQRRIAIMQSAPGKVLGRRRGHCQTGIGHIVRFPPVELGNALGFHAPGFEVGADAERGHERHVALDELADRRVVEMIVVIV